MNEDKEKEDSTSCLNCFSGLFCRCTPRNGNRHAAFTLAEVLITLMIIAIIAVVTIPAIVNEYQKKQAVVGLQKAYATLSQAVNMSIAVNGVISAWEGTTTSSTDEKERFVQKYFVPYLNVQKYVSATAPRANWSFPIYSLSGQVAYYTVDPFLILSDGTGVAFYTNRNNQVGITLFLKGAKGKHILGKDVFPLYLSPELNQILINGVYYNYARKNYRTRNDLINQKIGGGGYGCKNSGSGRYDGYFCGALILYDNWKISDDYPW